jgi:transcriptional regulator with XRE-family HTH domain
MNDGEKLKMLRMIRGFSQKGIAKKLGITQQAYSKLENQSKKLSRKRVDAILKTLDCSNEEFEKVEKFFAKPSKK